jgi:hypothetical protein
MAITIENNGASLKITDGASVRNVYKSQIVEIAVIKANIIKIDIGQGALNNVFIPFVDVTQPVTPNAAALRDALNDLLAPASGGLVAGSATEAKQTEQIGILTTMSGSLDSIKGLVGRLDDKTFYEELLVDDGGAGVIYTGYALNGGANQGQPVWAIKRIRKEGDVSITTWADGNKNFDNVWDNREVLIYS